MQYQRILNYAVLALALLVAGGCEGELARSVDTVPVAIEPVATELPALLRAAGEATPPTPEAATADNTVEELAEELIEEIAEEVLPTDWLAVINHHRERAGVPPVVEAPALSNGCWEHARYMAENNIISHAQNPSLPFASAAGERCARAGNVWKGGGTLPFWNETDAIEGWMASVGHRLWLLYPGATAVGFSYYESSDFTAAAALDVLTHIDYEPQAYSGWPVLYPAPLQQGVPAVAYPITLLWPYFGPVPAVDDATLTAVAAGVVPIAIETTLAANHKGILLQPLEPLAPNTEYEARVEGSYAGERFSLIWRFSTQGAFEQIVE